MQYQQFNYNERLCIAKYLATDKNISITKISKILNRSKSSVWNEIKRNLRPDGFYLASDAEEKARSRKFKPRGAYKKDNPVIIAAVKEGLPKKFTPKIIAAQLRKQYPDEPGNRVSHQTIYEMFRQDRRAGGSWYKHLPRGNKKRRKRYGTREKRGQIKNRVSIDERPQVVDQKLRVGDWEGDTIAGCKGGGALLSFVERSGQYLVLDLMPDSTSASLNAAVKRSFKRHGLLPTETLTLDNGREFAGHEKLSKDLGVDIYFAHPYHSWERGLNEQINGMVRWWFPKGTDFGKVSRAEVRKVEKLLNERPRERLGYRTPAEVMRKFSVLLQI